MPVFQRLVDYDKLFQSLSITPTILNDLDLIDQETNEYVHDLLITTLNNQSTTLSASCQCGESVGQYLIGTTCPKCNTVVQSQDSIIEPNLWIRAPRQVVGFISPHLILMLQNLLKQTRNRSEGMSKSEFDVLRWIIDTSYAPRGIKRPPIIDDLIESGLPRGYNNFITNMEAYIRVIMNNSKYRAKLERIELLLKLIDDNKDSIISTMLPIPNKMFIIVENTATGKYVDKSATKVIDAALSMVGIDHDEELSDIKAQNRVAKALISLSSYYMNYYANTWSRKKGHFRKHIFGTRTFFTFRAVISSLTDPHRYDEIHIPWGVGLTAFRPHIINKLVQRGYSQRQAVKLIYTNISNYHTELDEIMNELINETPGGKGIPVVIIRNPSLKRGSAQLVHITKVKTNPLDNTTSISIQIIKAPNGDFDGDEMNVHIPLDNYMASLLYKLAPHYNIVSPDKYRKFTGNNFIPKPVIATMSNWLYRKDTLKHDEHKYKTMVDLFGE